MLRAKTIFSVLEVRTDSRTLDRACHANGERTARRSHATAVSQSRRARTHCIAPRRATRRSPIGELRPHADVEHPDLRDRSESPRRTE